VDRRTGVLCGRCEDKYYAKGNACLECPSMTVSIVGFVFIFLFFAFVLNVLFKSDAKVRWPLNLFNLFLLWETTL
jgi:hypothetical protein